MFVVTTALKKIIALQKRIKAIQGGTSASKTISILQNLIDLAQRDEKATLTSIVSESIPHLKKGCIRDFKKIMKEHNYWQDKRWFETDKIYTFETGSQIEFFGADQAEKLRGGRRERLFINEANNVSFNAFEELEVRTLEFIFLDWNPTTEFWFYSEIQGKRDDVDHIILTYEDNEACPPEIRASIEQRKNRKGWWQVYGLGQLGEIEGKIYTNWKIIDDIPHEARLERRGLDYGYTNDPTAIVDIYRYNGGLILDQRLYQKGWSNRQLADFLKNLSPTLLIADSAEPKSNDELLSYGISILGAVKGQGSVSQGIQLVQDQSVSVTKSSVELIKEYRNYLWLVDKNGRVLNIPEEGFNHCMDAIRYAVSSMFGLNNQPFAEDLIERRQEEEILNEYKQYGV